MTYITYVGLAAGSLTTIAFMPQVIKTWKTKRTDDISLGMFLSMSIGIALWVLYGFLNNDFPLVVANFVTLVLSITILIFKLKYQ